MDFENMARQLEASPDYKVLRRLVTRTHFHDLPAAGLKRGAIVDTETTGVDAAHDEIIELGMVAYSYDASSGQVHRVLETISELEQPSKPIPPETTKVHGITDDMVHGKRIDDAKVAAMLSGVDLVIAHNAAFDRAVQIVVSDDGGVVFHAGSMLRLKDSAVPITALSRAWRTPSAPMKSVLSARLCFAPQRLWKTRCLPSTCNQSPQAWRE